MDIAPPGGPPGGGTYEGAYDNTAGTVAMLLYARAFADLTFDCDTFLALWSSEEEGFVAPMLSQTTSVITAYRKIRN